MEELCRFSGMFTWWIELINSYLAILIKIVIFVNFFEMYYLE